MDSSPPQLSVVVPVGPDDRVRTDLFEILATLGAECEVVISTVSGCAADAGSASTPCESRIVRIDGPAGRARQLNRGVAAASAPLLWLLHADCVPEPRAVDAALRHTADPADGIGWFELAFDRDGPAATRLNAWGANLRSHLLALPFGDQGLLLARALYDQLGGFDPGFGIGEDLDFIERARAAGVPIRRLPGRVRTSARRYSEHGWLRTTCRHLRLTLELRRRSRARARNLPT